MKALTLSSPAVSPARYPTLSTTIFVHEHQLKSPRCFWLGPGYPVVYPMRHDDDATDDEPGRDDRLRFVEHSHESQRMSLPRWRNAADRLRTCAPAGSKTRSARSESRNTAL